MAGTYSYTQAVAAAMLAAVSTQIGAGGQIILYSGTPPASARAALSGNTPLVTLNLPNPAIASTSDTGSAARGTFGAIAAAVVAASANAAFWRTLTSGGTVIDQGSCGLSGSGADMILSTLALSAGSNVTLSSRYNEEPYGP